MYRHLYRCPPGWSSTPQQLTQTSQPWMNCLIGWWRICQPTTTRSHLSMEISDWKTWYSIQLRCSLLDSPLQSAACLCKCFTLYFCYQARVIAVLDWELSTTGQPLADLAYFLMPHYFPTSLNVISSISSVRGIEGKYNNKQKSWYLCVNTVKWVCSLIVCPCLSNLVSPWAGVPTVKDVISVNCRCRGIPSALPQLNFYLALSVFKMAGIAQVWAQL